MNEHDFAELPNVFKAALKGIRNDETLGDFLVELGASLVALGVQENKSQRQRKKQ
jgi:hypothetical protein